MAPFRQTTLPAHLNPAKAPMGRPTHYRPEYCQMVIERMGDGLSLTGFAGSIGESREAVYDWIRAHPDFGHAVARARSARVQWWEEKLKKSRKGAETSASIFALRNADPVEWRDVRTTEHNLNVNVNTLTDAQLNAIAAGASLPELGIIESKVIDVTPAAPSAPASTLGTELGTASKPVRNKRSKSKA